MYALSFYTTDRDDADLIPNVIISSSNERNDIVAALISEMYNDYQYGDEISSPHFDEIYDGKIEGLKEFLQDKFEDIDVYCIVLTRRRFNYENVYTINKI